MQSPDGAGSQSGPLFVGERHHRQGPVGIVVDDQSELAVVKNPTAERMNANTGTSTGRMMLAVMAGMADVERDLIRTRTAEGRARAAARGQHMGRPPKLNQEQQPEAIARRDAGEAVAEIARTYNVNRMTITRLKP
jgi:DNA invertase Pin-like site-specific DNA recombinase